MTAVDDDRLVNIEIKLAHQEDTLSSLNEALTSQQAQVSRLQSLLETLVEKVKALSEEAHGESGDEERPPHY